MRSLIKILFPLCFPVFVNAQFRHDQLDSMYKVMKRASGDTILMDAYTKLGAFYDDVNLDSSLYYSEQGIAIARKLKLKMNEAEMLMNMSFPLTKKGNYPQALRVLTQALEIAEDPLQEKNGWHLKTGINPEKYRFNLLGYIHLGFGFLYSYTGNHNKRIATYIQGIRFAELSNDTLLLALLFGDVAGTYNMLNKFDSSLFFAQKALQFSSALPMEDRKFEGDVYSGIGHIYRQKGNLELAKENFEKAIWISEKASNPALAADGSLQLAKLFQIINKPDSSLKYYNKALATYKELGAEKYTAFAYRMISDFYWKQKNRDSSFAYLRLATLLNDSLSVSENKRLQEYQSLGFDEELRLQELEKEKVETQSKIRTYALLAGLGIFLIIGLLLYRNNRQKRKANKVLETTLDNLKATQSQLIQSEKMASLGELTAGIAHEIQNPLNFVNNFSEVNKELAEELELEIDKGNYGDAKTLAKDIRENEEKIHHHGKRADAIVKGMLQHSRNSSGQKEPTDINALADEYLRLAYHGLRAKDTSFNATIKTDFDKTIGKINIIPQDIGRVILNLITNAFYAASLPPEGRLKDSNNQHEPTVRVSTKKIGDKVFLSVKDNGPGIPKKILDKIFQPFFTTKPTGQGTGLGLSLSYDIIKAHRGEIKIETKENEGAEFIVELPAR